MDQQPQIAKAPADLSYDEIAEGREKYLSPSLATFTAYHRPLGQPTRPDIRIPPRIVQAGIACACRQQHTAEATRKQRAGPMDNECDHDRGEHYSQVSDQRNQDAAYCHPPVTRCAIHHPFATRAARPPAIDD